MRKQVLMSKSFSEAIFAILAEKKRNLGMVYTLANMAKACGVTQTYLSRSLHEKARMSADQLFVACEYLGCPDDEAQFIQLLYEWEEATNTRRKDKLAIKIQNKRSAYLTSDKNLTIARKSTDASLETYFINPIYQVVHIYLSIDEYAKNPLLILKKLQITLEELNRSLSFLESEGIIASVATGYTTLEKNLHLSQTSQVFPSYRILLRNYAANRFERSTDKDKYSFSVLFSSNDDERTKIKQDFLELIQKAEQRVNKNLRKESVYFLGFDLFEI